MDLAAIQESHFATTSMLVFSLETFFKFIYSAYGDGQARGVSLLVKHSLDVRLEFVHVDARCQLVVADIAVKSGSFRVVPKD